MALVVAALAVARRPVWVCALVGLAAAAVQAALAAGHLGDAVATPALAAATALWLKAVLVIGPGLVLNAVLARRGAHEELADRVRRLPVARAWKHSLVLLGVGPALECVTGFGVSLLVTVPILTSLEPRRDAVRRACTGMVMIPWGTFGLATALAADLAGQPMTRLGTWSAGFHLLTVPALGTLACALGPAPDGAGQRLRRAAIGFGQGVLCGGVLFASNATGVGALAGLLSGLAVIAAVLGVLLVGRLRTPPRQRPPLPGPPLAALAPYALAVGLLAAVRAASALGLPVDLALAVGGQRVDLGTSPGLPLLLAAAVTGRRELAGAVADALRGGWRIAVALAGFVAMAQLMTHDGAVAAVAGAVAARGGVAVTLLSPVLGLGSGLLTGSATSGNALMMPAQAAMAAGSPLGPVLTGLQNAGAGIGMQTSLPTAALICAISGDRTREAERALVGHQLRLLAVLVPLLWLGCLLVRP